MSIGLGLGLGLSLDPAAEAAAGVFFHSGGGRLQQQHLCLNNFFDPESKVFHFSIIF